jgi:nucleoside phosphorylase
MRVAVGSALKSEMFFLRDYIETANVAPRRTLLPRLAEFVTGVGQVSALSGCLTICERARPHVVLFIGCAGGADSRCEIGDTIICESVIGSVGGQEVILCSTSELVRNALQVFSVLPRVHVGRAFSSRKFISSESARLELSSRHGAICVETEGLAIATVCAFAEVQWLMVRVVTDNADRPDMADPARIRSELNRITLPVCRFLDHMIALEDTP